MQVESCRSVITTNIVRSLNNNNMVATATPSTNKEAIRKWSLHCRNFTKV